MQKSLQCGLVPQCCIAVCKMLYLSFRVLTVGTRFTSLEHTNQLKEKPLPIEKPTQPSTKVAFWKKGTGSSKVPGRQVFSRFMSCRNSGMMSHSEKGPSQYSIFLMSSKLDLRVIGILNLCCLMSNRMGHS